MDVREKLVELLNEVQETGVNEIPAGFGCTREYVKNEKVASHLIAHGVTVQEWISVDDRLPEDASTVLAIDSYGTICSAYYAGRWHGGGDLDEDAVTYWMTLPIAPKEDK